MAAQSNIHGIIAAEGADLPVPPWAEIGRGVWGTVYDLGDGTVLKLTRLRGGIGDGGSKFTREIDLLSRIGGLATDVLRLPALIDHRRFDLEAPHGLAGWLRVERLGVRPLIETDLARFSETECKRHGERMGAAVAVFHAEARALSAAPASLYPDPIERSLEEAIPDLEEIGHGDARAALADAWGRAKRGIEPVPCHGDPNLSNMLWAEDDPLSRPLGLVDFAESGLGVPEVDLRHAEDFGPLTQSFLSGFTAAAERPADAERLALVAAVNALMKVFFAARSGDPQARSQAERQLDLRLARAGIAV